MSDVQATLAELGARHPLPSGWTPPECFVETAAIGELRVELVGLMAQSASGEQATGSAGERGRVPVDRAYFELLERACVLEALSGQAPTFSTFQVTSDEVVVGGAVDRTLVFPSAPEGASFRYARSNAVAAHHELSSACAAALAELIERDRLLLSWYGQTAPQRTRVPAELELQALEEHYELEAYSLPPCNQSPAMPGWECAAVFGFPKHAQAPLIWGSAAASTWSQALRRAAGECVQRAGFLWGQDIPTEAPPLQPTADFHQEYFLHAEAHPALRRWLCGEHVRSRVELRAQRDFIPHTVRRFADIGDQGVQGMWVVRAIPQGELALVFGEGHPAIVSSLPRALAVHPIC